MNKSFTVATAVFLGLAAISSLGCAAQRIGSESELREVKHDSSRAISEFSAADPGLRDWVSDSYGYAVFPAVSKAGLGIGGAYGQGMVFEQGKAIGTSAISQGSIGLQAGGQSFKEIIFFEDRDALVKFITGRFEFSAQASAVAVTAGASSSADFYDGMAIFTMPNGGLMFEASIGGQKFTYRPLD